MALDPQTKLIIDTITYNLRNSQGYAIENSTGTVVVSSGTVSANILTFPPDDTESGSLEAPDEAVTHSVVNGESTIGIQITGTWTGQIEFEISIDGTNWEAHDFINNATDQIVNATSGNGIFFASLSAFKYVRARASALSSGAAVVTMKISVGTESFHLESPLPAGSNTIGKVNINGENLPTLTFAVNGASGSTIIAASASNKHRLFKLMIAADSTGVVTISDGFNAVYMPANGTVNIDFGPIGKLQGTANTAITVTNSGGGNVSAHGTYSTESA